MIQFRPLASQEGPGRDSREEECVTWEWKGSEKGFLLLPISNADGISGGAVTFFAAIMKPGWGWQHSWYVTGCVCQRPGTVLSLELELIYSHLWFSNPAEERMIWADASPGTLSPSSGMPLWSYNLSLQLRRVQLQPKLNVPQYIKWEGVKTSPMSCSTILCAHSLCKASMIARSFYSMDFCREETLLFWSECPTEI